MTIDTQIVQALEHMPDNLKHELLHYAEYLIANYAKDNSGQGSQPLKRRSGILQGTFVLPLPDDFDEPLEDFQDYMS
ncbi:type II toxin-antitoxin system VapB family antitoxin [Leptolyngbya iicbica]|uniref:DUF2281 domain-containing protein n=2 Tax=Cyanophyceae TaxID=3028117 RepID=A0A4Q7EI21_9CYAN|nr:DUF2281 domain-containing protein [Leptolyngbya sp. LK]RZM82746.1 DUF2281 domain-containing protein [Leptolyngbya sp. LK]